MQTEFYQRLINAVSPFDEGVAALKLRVLRGAPENANLSRPNNTAAVLVPVLDTPEPQIVLTVRAETLLQHPGQVSFPGGRVDENDRSAISTALREAEEEIGLDFSQVSPMGFLDRVDTISDYRVLPVVGLVRSSFVWQPDYREVAEVFTVPLALAVDRNAYRLDEMEYEGRKVQVPSLMWKGHRIWGITAAILHNFGSRLRNSGGFSP
jgi:8-oxo-dGTP pyrophosphatase MutT (NUDIX family)